MAYSQIHAPVILAKSQGGGSGNLLPRGSGLGSLLNVLEYILMPKPAKNTSVTGWIHGIEFHYFPTTGKLLRSGKPVTASNSYGQPHLLVGKFWVTVARVAFELMDVYVDREQRIEMIDGDPANTRWLNMRITDGVTKFKEETPAGTGWNNPVQFPDLRKPPGGLK